ncbi:acetolactate synthase 2 catalytic subunit [Arsenophonus nasoniae]|uniref:Acetolactate synthase n=1 Tax=Arsenophonus nasoniae TaxID=638 RepID=A0AA95GFB3_9GAMM|nr:acetolactate synthase 2 catalytic subunit [Arsenophonus nasoniae]WGL95245.1 acetolactate synthase 2 catalytic subunit [Arsenophonus nasoniae]
MNGAQWLVQALISKGVEQIFGYPGGAIMSVYDALYDSDLQHLLCRHEQGAVMAAMGYARATNKPGVCIATSGPGATNLITGLADALLDSVPIVAITGQVALEFIGTDAFQEVDILSLSLACTKHSFLVDSVEMLPQIITEAFSIATTGRPGPVLIDIPKDIQLQTTHLLPYFMPVEEKSFYSANQLATACEIMQQAKQPILYVGGGVGMSGAVSELRDFIAITGLPTVATLKGLGAVTADDPHYLGMLGMHGSKAANFAVQECDLLLAVGARFDDRVTGKLNTFAPHAKVIHLDIDHAELNKLRQAHVCLLGDAKLLLPRLARPLNIALWQAKVSALKTEYAWNYNHTGDSIDVPALLKQISERMHVDTIVTTDVGQHQMWTAQHMSFRAPENFITSSGLGSMGFGIPAAIGAQLARPNAAVICVSGDGSFMMNIQELATIKRKQLPIKIVLIDNQRLGMVRQWQELFFQQRYSETQLTDNPDFVALAASFDIAGQRITHTSEINNALDRLFSHAGPYLLQVSIDELENVWPLVPPGASNEKMMEKPL